jgi:hypothetical protein
MIRPRDREVVTLSDFERLGLGVAIAYTPALSLIRQMLQ